METQYAQRAREHAERGTAGATAFAILALADAIRAHGQPVPVETFDPETAGNVERARVAACARIGAYTMQSMELRSWAPPTIDGLVLELTAELLRHRLASRVETVDWRGTTTLDVEIEPSRRLRAWEGIAITGAAVAIGALLSHLLIVAGYGLGVVLAAISLRLFNAPAPGRAERRTISVGGTVDVRCEAFDTFPRADIVYPPELGQPVHVVVYTPADADIRAEGAT